MKQPCNALQVDCKRFCNSVMQMTINTRGLIMHLIFYKVVFEDHHSQSNFDAPTMIKMILKK